MEQRDQLGILCRLSMASSLQEVVDLSGELLANPIFVADMSHTILAYSNTPQVIHYSWQSNVIEATRERSVLKQEREVAAIHSISTDNKLPVYVDDDNLPFPRIIKTLVNRRRAVGVVVLTAYLKELGEGDIELLEVISSFVLTHLKKEEQYTLLYSHSVENYFIKLLNGGNHSAAQIKIRLEQLNWKSLSYVYLITFWLEHEKDGSGELFELIESFASLPECCCFLYNNTIVCIYNTDQEIYRWEETIVYSYMRKWRLVAGVSHYFRSFEKIREHYHQAVTALRIGQILKRPCFIHTYDNVSAYQLFEEVPVAALNRFCHQKILELERCDKKNDSQLCKTLLYYLENNRSLSATAKKLFIHKNTVNYRINKCLELLDGALEEKNDFFSIILSLHIVEYKNYFGKYVLGDATDVIS